MNIIGLSRFKPSSSVVNHTRLLLVLMAQLVGASLSGLCRAVRNRFKPRPTRYFLSSGLTIYHVLVALLFFLLALRTHRTRKYLCYQKFGCNLIYFGI